MSANTFKRLNVSDTFVVPYTANKSWDIDSGSFADQHIVINVGTKYTGTFDPETEYFTNNQYDRLVYESTNFSYYPTFYSKVVSTSSLQNTVYNDGTLSTSSYWKGINAYNPGNLDTVKFFPTGNGDVIYVINVPKTLTGDKILPTTFELTFVSASTTCKLYDDGNYNLLYSGSNISSSINTVLSQSSYVGNVFYEQNIAVITVIPNNVRATAWRGANPYCVQTSPSATPTNTPSISVTPSVTPTISVTPSITPSLSVGASNTPTPTPSVTPSVTPSNTATPSITPSVTSTPSITPSITPSVTPSTSEPTIRIDWTLSPGNGGGGLLEMHDANGVQILNQSTSGTSQNGTIYLSASETPYSVTGSWSAGSGNIVRYRICDVTNLTEIYYSGDIDNVTGSISYLVNPTPLHSSVHLTSGTSTYPIVCPV